MASSSIYTIGHSTRSLEDFIAMLEAHDVTALIDIRTVPKSRRYPHFAGEALSTSLPAAGISYDWMRELGGLRKPRPDSKNTAWRNLSFRGYADHMQTKEFNQAVDELVTRAEGESIAIMCSEAVPWRCHRSLVGDALLVRGVRVVDIMSETKATPHELTSFAQVDGTRVTYPHESNDQQ